jgi:hypothetical protein
LDLIVLIGGGEERAAMFAETLDYTQHSSRLIPERKLHIELQPRKPGVHMFSKMNFFALMWVSLALIFI